MTPARGFLTLPEVGNNKQNQTNQMGKQKTNVTEVVSFTIEDGVPLPPRKGRAAGVSKYPFAKLAVGQSFAVPEKQAPSARRLVGIFTKANPEVRITGRTMPDKSVRFWRTPDAVTTEG